MAYREGDNYWISAYIYFDGNIYDDFCDDVIRDILSPFLENKENLKLFEKYFFIRYSESGSHLRVRFLGDKSELEKELKTRFENQISQNISDFFTERNKIDGKRVLDVSKFFIKWVPYEPEIERYGGKEAIKVAEEYFFYSSNTAVELIKLLQVNDKSSRLGKGLALIVIILFKFCNQKEKSIKLISSYSSGYLRAIAKEEKYYEAWVDTFNAGFNSQSEKLVELVNNLWQILEDGEELPEILDNFSKNMEVVSEKLRLLSMHNKIVYRETQINDWDTCVFSIVPSYIHMMNNRLGITIQEESYLAHLVSKGINIENPVK